MIQSPSLASGRSAISILFAIVVVLSLVGGLFRFLGKGVSPGTRRALMERIANREAAKEEANFVAEAKKVLPVVIEALEKGDYETAVLRWEELGLGSESLENYPALQPDLPRLGKGIDAAYRKLLAALAADEAAAEEVEFFVDQFRLSAPDPKFRYQYNQDLKRITIDRAKLMPHRVMIEVDDFDYLSTLAEALGRRWPEEYPVDATYGRALSDLERNAAFAAYEFKVIPTFRTETVLGTEIDWPSMIKLEFKVKKKAPCPTTWDGMAPIEIEIPRLKPLPANATESQAIEVMGQQLSEAIAAAMEKRVPVWAPVSEMGGTSLKDSSGNYSTSEAAALFLNTPEQFESKLAAELKTANTTASQAALRAIIAALHQEKYASWYEKSLAYASPEEVDRSAKMLSRRPFFGGYVPFARTLALAKNYQPVPELYSVSPEEIVRVIYPLFLQQKVPQRGTMFRSQLGIAPPELAEPMWNLILAEPDEAARKELITLAFLQAERGKWWSVLFDVALPNATEPVRAEIYEGISKWIGKAEVPMLLKFAESTQDPVLRTGLLDTLRKATGDVREEATKQMATLKDEALRSQLAQVLEEPPTSARQRR